MPVLLAASLLAGCADPVDEAGDEFRIRGLVTKVVDAPSANVYLEGVEAPPTRPYTEMKVIVRATTRIVGADGGTALVSDLPGTIIDAIVLDTNYRSLPYSVVAERITMTSLR